MGSETKALTVQSEIWLFEVPLYMAGSYRITKVDGVDTDKVASFSVRVGNKTLGEVLNYILETVGAQRMRLDPPWDVIDRIRLDNFAFLVESKNGLTSFGFTYSNLGIDLGFLKLDKLGALYTPKSAENLNKSFNINVYGSFLGISFQDKPISWDALKEQPPKSPSDSESVFKLDYLGLGQRVTLGNIAELKTIGQVMDGLTRSYEKVAADALNPLVGLKTLVYDESAAWLVGAKFTLLETLDFQGLWNLPALAGARLGLRGERAKSLAGLEFEILYRKIAEDLGQYHIELVLPDVLRKFQAGAASVTLPIIGVDIYTDGGFKIDLGFPTNLDFSRSFSIEMMVAFIPVTGSIGVYFGILSPRAVPGLPAIIDGSFGPVIVAGVGFRIGVGKSFEYGILKAGFFLGIEGLIEGVLGFYEPFEKSEPKAVYFRCNGMLQLTGHIFGEIDFAIVSASVDIYAYIRVQASFEVYRATVLTFEAGVRVKVKAKLFWFITIELSFSATIRHDAIIGNDQQTPWQVASGLGTTLKERLGPVGYRHLPTGEIVTDQYFALLLDPHFNRDAALTSKAGQTRPASIRRPDTPERLELYFHPIAALGIEGDSPGAKPDPAKAQVNLIASLMISIDRKSQEALSPAELFAAQVLRWGIGKVQELLWLVGANLDGGRVTLSQLEYLQKHLEGAVPPIEIKPEDVWEFFTYWAKPEVLDAPWSNQSDGPGLTSFPMIPFLTLTAGEGENTAYTFNFETGPLCSPAYQQEIRSYFANLKPMRDGAQRKSETVVGPLGQDLSMTELIFIDSFKLVLRNVLADAIDVMTLLPVQAAGRTLARIAIDHHMDHAAGLLRIIEGNVDNPAFFDPARDLTIAATGVPLTEVQSLAKLAERLKQPSLWVARTIYTQPILRQDGQLKLAGVSHLLAPTDTPASILAAYGIASWEAVLEANPGFDWAVPGPVKDPVHPYPELTLPAGSWIDLPELTVPATAPDGIELRTLEAIALHYRLPLGAITAQPDSVMFQQEGLVRPGISVTVGSAETATGLAARVGLVTAEDISRAVLFDPAVLASGAPIQVPPGQYVIARGDNLYSIAAVFQTTPEAIQQAQGDGGQWRLWPRPVTDETLPMGVTITLPPIAAFVPAIDDTYADIAVMFGLDPVALANANAATFVLPPMLEIALPPMRQPAGWTAQSPAALGQKFGIDPAGLIRANQGAAGEPGAAAPLGTVNIPRCESIPEDMLIARLSDQTTGSRLKGAVQAQALFIMSGLRLPAPGAVPVADDPETSLPLYPLYTLSGQQWAAPAVPEGYWAQLTWNAESTAAFMVQSPPRESPPRVHLTTHDIALINGFRTVSANPAQLQPQLIARAPYPAFQQLRSEVRLGAATPLMVPQGINFTAPLLPDPVEAPMLIEIPTGLRALLPADDLTLAENAKLSKLEVSQNSAHPISGQPVRRELTNVGWATRIDMQVRETFGSEESGGPLKGIYEAVSISAQGQADLEGLRNYVKRHHGIGKIDLYLFHPTDPLAHGIDMLRADAISPEARASIVLLKSNLSTISHAAGAVRRFSPAEVKDTAASASLDSGGDFLELLWQISVANGGGFFLGYPPSSEDGGLSPSMFEGGKSAQVTILAVLRDKDNIDSIAPARFHNVLLCSDNLASAEIPVQVRASMLTVGEAPGTEPRPSESLGAIAGAAGIGVVELARLNQSSHALLQAGVQITVDLQPDPPRTYTVEPGDDLIGVAAKLGVTFDQLVGAIKAQEGLLVKGAQLAGRAGWFTGKNTVEPQQGGFTVLRSQPIEPPPVDVALADEADPLYRIQTMFSMMGYSLDAANGFAASNHGLAIFPDEPDDSDQERRFAVEPGTAQPWVYRRLLPIADFYEGKGPDRIDFLDPYGGLGKKARVAFGFQDIFGNRLPRQGPSEAIDWAQYYRDPLVPLHAWPSVTLSYDVFHDEKNDAPQIIIEVKFAPAGYTAALGVTAKQLADEIKADRTRYGLIYYQVADWRIEASVISALNPGERPIIESQRMARLAGDAFAYLGALSSLEPLTVKLDEQTTISDLALAASVDVAEVAQHIGIQPKILRVGAILEIPEFLTVRPDVSINDIIAQARAMGDELDPGELGELNPEVLLTSGLFLRLPDGEAETQANSTLSSITPQGITIAEMARLNADVKALFRPGEQVFVGVLDVAVAADQELAGIANAHAIALDVLAEWNAQTAIFAPGQTAELPLHLRIAPGTPSTARIDKKVTPSLDDFVKLHNGSVRDVATANTATTDLLVPGTEVFYGTLEDLTVHSTVVTAADTLGTVTLRLAKLVGDASLKPADVADYAANSRNRELLVDGALLLLPPIRFNKAVNVPSASSNAVIIEPLSVQVLMVRPQAMVDPAFREVDGVTSVVSVVPARRSTGTSRIDRTTLLAFARQFEKTFPNLKLSVGPQTFASVALTAGAAQEGEPPSKLVAVNWGEKKGFFAEVNGPAHFFAPRPLLNLPWNGLVAIKPYIPGQPLDPNGDGGTPTCFNSVDLERWAGLLLSRIDRILQPDMALSIRRLAPAEFEKIIAAKAKIAQAVADRVELVLEPSEETAAVNVPDRISAAETLRQQMLVELSSTYRGGVVIQYNVEGRSPDRYNPAGSVPPRLLCGLSQVMAQVPEDAPTLEGLAGKFSAKVELVARLLSDTEYLLQPGFKVPVGTKPKVTESSTIASVCKEADVPLEQLVAAVGGEVGFLKSGAAVPLSIRTIKTESDETLASALERLAPNQTARDLQKDALAVLLELNGKVPSVFAKQAEIYWQGKPHQPKPDESFDTFAERIGAGAERQQLYYDNLVTAPLLATGKELRFLAHMPPVVASSSKITLHSAPGVPNKLNTVLVNSSPDEASNIPVQLSFRAQALEYNIHEDADESGNQASEWLTFVDLDFAKTLDPISVPVPNRQFPLAPQILAQNVLPRVEDGKVDPARIEELMLYDYELKFAFDAAAQDEITYTRYEPVIPGSTAATEALEPATLATRLAQYQAIDEALWADVLVLRLWDSIDPDAGLSAITGNALKIFADLSANCAEAWLDWRQEGATALAGERFRIRRHLHPEGSAVVTVVAVKAPGPQAATTLPRARLVGREYSVAVHDGLTATTLAQTKPVPRTHRGESYVVDDPGLSLLEHQRCWGGISVMRNSRLVSDRETAPGFVLRVPDVRAVSYLTPSLEYAQRIDLGKEVAPLKDRLRKVFERLYFPQSKPHPDVQLVSITVNYARSLTLGSSGEDAEPADWRTLFVPVATTPLLELHGSGSGDQATPEVLANELTNRLEAFLAAQGLAPRESWSFTLNLFCRLDEKDRAARLLELSDVRIRMSDQ